MKFTELSQYLHIPDGVSATTALERTTHLAIGAHQDDLEIFAYHGISTCYDSGGQWFGGITVTDGGGSARTGPYAHYSDEQMKAVRFEEQNRAADIGRYSFQAQLGLPSSEVKAASPSHAVVKVLAQFLRSCRPHTLYLHNPADKHPSHLAVLTHCVSALRALEPELRPERIYGCEVWRGLDWLRDADKIALPTDAHPELSRQLLDVFASQIVGGKSYTTATLGRRQANATFFQSHQVDGATSLTFAMDLQPLMDEPELTLHDLALRHVNALREDVQAAYTSLPCSHTEDGSM